MQWVSVCSRKGPTRWLIQAISGSRWFSLSRPCVYQEVVKGALTDQTLTDMHTPRPQPTHTHTRTDLRLHAHTSILSLCIFVPPWYFPFNPRTQTPSSRAQQCRSGARTRIQSFPSIFLFICDIFPLIPQPRRDPFLSYTAVTYNSLAPMVTKFKWWPYSNFGSIWAMTQCWPQQGTIAFGQMSEMWVSDMFSIRGL